MNTNDDYEILALLRSVPDQDGDLADQHRESALVLFREIFVTSDASVVRVSPTRRHRFFVVATSLCCVLLLGIALRFTVFHHSGGTNTSEVATRSSASSKKSTAEKSSSLETDAAADTTTSTVPTQLKETVAADSSTQLVVPQAPALRDLPPPPDFQSREEIAAYLTTPAFAALPSYNSPAFTDETPPPETECTNPVNTHTYFITYKGQPALLVIPWQDSGSPTGSTSTIPSDEIRLFSFSTCDPLS